MSEVLSRPRAEGILKRHLVGPQRLFPTELVIDAMVEYALTVRADRPWPDAKAMGGFIMQFIEKKRGKVSDQEIQYQLGEMLTKWAEERQSDQ